MEALPANRKVDRWHEAMVNDNIWHRWFLAGTVESEFMLSRSALAHIYDNVKATTVHRSDPPREVRLACTARAALAFKPDILFLVN